MPVRNVAAVLLTATFLALSFIADASLAAEKINEREGICGSAGFSPQLIHSSRLTPSIFHSVKTRFIQSPLQWIGGSAISWHELFSSAEHIFEHGLTPHSSRAPPRI